MFVFFGVGHRACAEGQSFEDAISVASMYVPFDFISALIVSWSSA
jgi:hypothetical protein